MASSLLADLPIPNRTLQVFKDCGVDTVALITWTKAQIVEALSQADKSWNLKRVWKKIEDWRDRNKLQQAVVFLPETSDEEPAGARLEIKPQEGACEPKLRSSADIQPLTIPVELHVGAQIPGTVVVSTNSNDEHNLIKIADISVAAISDLKTEVVETSVTVSPDTDSGRAHSFDRSINEEDIVGGEAGLVQESDDLPADESDAGEEEEPFETIWVVTEGELVEPNSIGSGSISSNDANTETIFDSNTITSGDPKADTVADTKTGIVTDSKNKTATPPNNNTCVTAPGPSNETTFHLQKGNATDPTSGVAPDPDNGSSHVPKTGTVTGSKKCTVPVVVLNEPDLHFSPQILKNLLQQSVIGCKLIEHAESCELSEASQKLVTDVIARYHLNLKRKTTSAQIRDYADVVVALFKKEKKATYYNSKERGNPGGKLYSRINYLRQSERRREKAEEVHFNKAKNSSAENKVVVSPKVASSVAWLELNKFPWHFVVSHWEISFPARKELLRKHNQFSTILKTFSQLLEEYGYQLLDIDFRLLGLGNPADGQRKWGKLIEPIGQYIAKHAKDPSAKDIIRTITNTAISTDLRLPAVLLGLNTVLIPVKAARGFKPTVATAQEDTILFFKTVEEALLELQKLYVTWEEQGIPITPKLVILSENYRTVSGDCLVIYKKIEYRLQTVTRAIDVIVKLNVVLGLQISRISKLIWLFIESFVYEVEQPYTYVCITKLKEYLDSIQPCSSPAASQNA